MNVPIFSFSNDVYTRCKGKWRTINCVTAFEYFCGTLYVEYVYPKSIYEYMRCVWVWIYLNIGSESSFVWTHEGQTIHITEVNGNFKISKFRPYKWNVNKLNSTAYTSCTTVYIVRNKKEFENYIIKDFETCDCAMYYVVRKVSFVL